MNKEREGRTKMYKKQLSLTEYSYVPHNEVSVNDGLHI